MQENDNSLNEALKNPFFKSEEKKEPELSSSPGENKTDLELDDEQVTIGFADDGSDYGSVQNERQSVLLKQKSIIMKYRAMAQIPEVDECKSEIINDAIFSGSNDETIIIDYNPDSKTIPDKVKEKITEEFETVLDLVNIKRNLYYLFDKWYTEGQLNLHTPYLESNTKEGIQKVTVLTPVNFYYDKTKEIWKYQKDENKFSTSRLSVEDEDEVYYDAEEIIRIDSGIYNGKIILSHLNKAVKSANQVKTLEDMLIPMRFSRSVSRRIFNIDVADLSNKKAEEYLRRMQNKFKYKKFYDIENGTISNQQHVASLVEDYWFPNRSGAKGTVVDTIDETGNLGELGDILYFQRKLYKSLNVPMDRINSEGSVDVDFSGTNTTREELKFFSFVSRLRDQFNEIFYELLKRQLVSKEIITLDEFFEFKSDIYIKFSAENMFYTQLESENLTRQIDQFEAIQPLLGKYFSIGYAKREIFGMSEDFIKEMDKEIEEERKAGLYDNEEDESGF